MNRSWIVVRLLAVLLLGLAGQSLAAQSIAIWPDGSPKLEGVAPEHVPRLFPYPGSESGKPKPAVLILPAGGYKHHSNMRRYVTFLNGLGVKAYVLKYRLPVHGYKHPAPLDDAERAMRMIRLNAGEWGVDPERVGVLGASSGGHLTSTLITHWDEGDKTAEQAIDGLSSRPDFAFMINSVVTMQGVFCHTPSRARLLPKNPSQALVDDLSNELQVTNRTPPTFVMHGGQDQLVPAENSLMFFGALRKHDVAFSELHFYSHGGHFFQPIEFERPAKAWLERLGVIGDLRKDPKLRKSLDDPAAWTDGKR